MRRKLRENATRYQRLEPRQLLAGDVTASFSGDTLRIVGDGSANEVNISINDGGDLEISGQNGTRINGSDNAVVMDLSAAMIEDLRVNLAGGDDMLFVEEIEIGNRAVIRGGGGMDSIGLFDVTVGDDLRVDAGGRHDNVSVDRLFIGDNLVINGSGGEDTIGIDDTTINGRTIINTGARSDRVAIRNSVHNDRVRIHTAGGFDFVSADGLDVNAVARVFTGGRSDNVFVNDTEFSTNVLVRGGGGNDNLEVTGMSTLAVAPDVSSFEGTDVVGGLPQTDQVFLDLVSSSARLGTIVEIATITPELSTLVGALEATELDDALAGDGPFTVFAPLNSAFDAISEVVADLSLSELTDVLLFHVTPDAVFADELVMMNSVDTLLGQSFTVNTTNGVVLNGNATLAATDIRAKNGVIHLLNDVLVP